MPIKLLLSLLTCTLLTLTSADGQTTGAIPPDFHCKDCILIIIKPESNKTIPGFEKKIDKHFKKYYTGKYEFATEKGVESESRFQDKKIYKFCLQYKIRSELTSRSPSSTETVIKDRIRFNLYDRECGIGYGSFAEARTDIETVERTAKILEANH